MTLLNTTTTQKVACPTTIVSRPGSRPNRFERRQERQAGNDPRQGDRQQQQ